MREVTRFCSVLALAAMFGLSTVERANAGDLVRTTIRSAALADNLIRDPTERSVFVYLPQSYHRLKSRRFPVVYLLHGVGDSNIDWTNGNYQGLIISSAADSLAASGKIGEVIIVMPDANNAFQGCFYTNSPVTGNWEDFVTKDLVGFIDKNFRTIKLPSARAIAGHSMGGYGAIKLAMKRPDLFSVVYAISPCCFDWDSDLSIDNPFWRRTLSLTSLSAQDEKDFYPKFFLTLAMVWSPNVNRPPFFGDLPFRMAEDKLVVAEPAYSAWAANLLLPMAGQFRTNLRSLRAIGIDYGSREQFGHISRGSRKFGLFLDANGIANRTRQFDGDHFDHVRERVEEGLLPFVTTHLATPK